MFRFPAILFGVLTALPVAAELVPLGDWPVDETRAVLQVEDELFRNCGRVLERWDLAAELPVLLDSLVLDSPPVDLLDWDGLLLVQRDDGVLEARDLAASWSQPLWILDAGTCATQLLRHGNLLLPMGRGAVRLVDLTQPSSPVLLPHVLGEGLGVAGTWGGDFAASVDGHLVGHLNTSCGPSWETTCGAFHMQLDSTGQADNAETLPGIDWQWDNGHAAAVANGVLVARLEGLDWVGPPSWRPEASLAFNSQQAKLAASGHQAWVSRRDSLYHLGVDPASDTPLSILHRLECQGGTDIQVLPGHLLVSSPDRQTWLGTAGAPVPLRTLDAPGSIPALAWAGQRLVIAQHGLRMVYPVGDGWEMLGRLDMFTGDFLDADDELIVAQVFQGAAVIHWPEGQATGQQVATLPTRCRWGLQYASPWALTCDSDTLNLWDLTTPSQPRWVGRHVEPYISFVAARGNLAAARVGTGEIRLFRLGADQLEAGALLPDQAMAFDFVGSLLVLGVFVDGVLHLRTYDAADPSQPTLLRDQVLPDDVWVITMQGGSERLALSMLESWHPPLTPGNVLQTYRLDAQDGWVRTGQKGGRDMGAIALSDDGTVGRLAAALPGEGVKIWLDDSTIPVEPRPERPSTLSLAAAPNPFNPVTRLSFTLERPGAARLVVFDLRGREVARPAAGDFSAGTHEIAFDASALASGIYVARLEAEGRTAVAKLALVR